MKKVFTMNTVTRKLILLAISLCCCQLFVQAETTVIMAGDEPYKESYDFEVDGCYYNILSLNDLTVLLTCRWENQSPVSVYSGDFRIPETVEYANKTFKVTQIDTYAFYGSKLGKLTIPATVENMACGWTNPGECQDLIIEDSENALTSYSYSFHDNMGIIGKVYNSVYVGRNINCNISGEYKSITFGDNITELGRICCGNDNLTSVELPSNIKMLNQTFQSCKNLKSVSGVGVEEVYGAFSESGIESINMPNLKILAGAFSGCTSMTSFTVPEGVIGARNFDYSEMSSRGSYLFSNCTNLTSIYIPATLIDLGEYSFTGCKALNTITVASANPIYIEENNFDAITYLTATLKVPVGSKEAYQKASIWKNFSNIEEDKSITCSKVTIAVDINGVTSYENLDRFSYSCSDDFVKYKYEPNPGTIRQAYIVPVGSSFTITIKSSARVKSFTINGEDKTSELKDNKYTFIANGGMVIWPNVSFEDGENPYMPMYYSVVGYSSDSKAGSVEGGGEFKEGETAHLYAYANDGYQFVKWSDGSTENPYKMEVHHDVRLIAYFQKEQADIVDINVDEVVVTPSSDAANIQWPQVENAYSYTLIIWADASHSDRICELVFDADGRLTSIDFSRKSGHNAYTQTSQEKGFSFTITGLNPETSYFYSIIAEDEHGIELSTEQGNFETALSTDITEIGNRQSSNSKLMKDGQLYITRDGKTYNAQGARVE